MPKKISLAIMMFCLAAPSQLMARSIKCVDSKGTTYYGDTIPPECADRPVTELDDKGVPVRETPANMTPEERRSMELEVQKEASEAQKAQDQRRHDSALLSSYASEAEIDIARDRNVQQLTLSLTNVEARLKTAKGKLDQLNSQAEGLIRSNKPIPPDLAQNLATAKQEYSDLEVEHAQKQQDLQAMKAKYDADKKRYRELTQKQPAQQQ